MAEASHLAGVDENGADGVLLRHEVLAVRDGRSAYHVLGERTAHHTLCNTRSGAMNSRVRIDV